MFLNSIKNIHPEYQYINLIKNILKHGDKKTGRNGTTYSIFGNQMKFSLRNNTIPLLTTKKVAWKTCLHELFWFINAKTHNKYLTQNNVSIWNGNSSRNFLDSRKLYSYNDGELGPIYGWQWRNFNGDYIPEIYRNQFSIKNAKKGTDQLQFIIDALNGTHPTENKFSRRLIVSAWNPNQLNSMALPPCHVLFQFYVNSNNELSCSMYQRSGDVGLGIPFNIASYSFLTHIIAHHCNLKPGDFIHTIGDAHIYDDHIIPLTKQIKRHPYKFPNIYILNKHNSINDYNINDIQLVNYLFHNKINMNMRP
jgi:thymidylate synthase